MCELKRDETRAFRRPPGAAWAASAFLALSTFAASPGLAQSDLTAAEVMEKMSTDERTAYLFGVASGLAQARLIRDKAQSVAQPDAGYRCILDWIAGGDRKRLEFIHAAFQRYPKHNASAVLYVMIKKACGE